MTMADTAGIDLYWLPLGAGGHVVRRNGLIYEAIVARREHREPCALYHAALQVHLPPDRFTLELAPAWGVPAPDRGVVVEGPVGLRWAGRLRLFRYELRLWRGGVIPDIAYAVDSPVRLSDDVAAAARLIDLAPQAPALTWGRDELRTGDMWNSNSVVSWLIAGSGLDVERVEPPTGGRAPGWRAGIAVAQASPPVLSCR